MEKRVFICGYYNFPRGSAASNYVQYLALAFIELNYKIIFITNENKLETAKQNNFLKKYSETVKLDKIVLAKNKIKHYLDYHYMLGLCIKRKLNRYNPNNNDLIISYSRDLFINKEILRVSKKTGAKSAVCIVEWFPVSEFKYLWVDKNYLEQKICFDNTYFKFDYVFPISEFIAQHFNSQGKETMCLPIMADPYEYESKQKEYYGKKIFVYPANGKLKDSLQTILESFSCLNDEELSRIELNICGIKKEKLLEFMPDRLKEVFDTTIVLHGWMEYDDLIKLYQKCHFLILAREDNKMTRANFPSKVPEVMSHGVIPIVSRVGDYTKYYLEDSTNSIIFDKCDVETCSEAVRRAINMQIDEQKELEKRVRLCIFEKFNYQVWSSKIEKFLKDSKH